MGGLFQCQSQYQCIESFMQLLLSIILLVYFIMKANIIYHKNKGILVLVDLILCAIALLQLGIQVLYFLFAGSSWWLITLRSLGLIQELIISTILTSVILNKHKELFLGSKIVFAIILMTWIIEIRNHYNEDVYLSQTNNYECSLIQNQVLSLYGIILSIIAFVAGFEVIRQLYEYKKHLMENMKDSFSHQLLKLEIRIIQIRILKLCGLLQFGIQFIWDRAIYFLSDSTLECKSFYIPSTYITVLLYSVLKFISLSTVPLAIYVVFFECNKEFFFQEVHIWNQRSIPHVQSHLSLDQQQQQQDQEQQITQYIEIQELK